MKKLLFLLAAAALLMTFAASMTYKKKAEKNIRINQPISLCGPLFSSAQDTAYLPVQLLPGLGDLHYPVSARDPQAQKYFDQGLRLIYGFNHVEALRSFQEAARLEPTFAMAYWGQALALGPNINDWNPMDREAMALEAITNARKLIQNCSEREIGFIMAMTTRYNGKAYAVRDSLNTTYRKSMQALSKKYPDDPEAVTLYADAIMTSIPWNYWNRDGSPRPMTNDARAALESVMKKYPRHPGAHHFYIHLVEASNAPSDALKSASFLETAMPSAGHLVHMPSHIYIRVGDYDKSDASNTQAVKVDEAFLALSDDQGMYRLGYYPHNIDFLCFGGMMNGRSTQAITNGNKLVYQMKPAESMIPVYYDFFLTTPVFAYMRFGKWNEILTLPSPDPKYYHASAVHHLARGTAFLRKGKLFEAKKELRELEAINRLDTVKSIYAFYNSVSEIVNVATHLLKGELLLTEHNVEAGIKMLQSAVLAEDTLRYNEPPDWRLPVRHYLGAALLESGRTAEAEKVYEEDLKKNPANGWALHGLLQAQTKLGKTKESAATAARFQKAWKNADVKISASRF
ncbi:MAG: hypothetical protein SH819_03370 [Cytophagales bacterium]|nr:hypothetical protein [Cytophagales bacterium]